ncbi:MAG: methyltransferase [Lutibacter sp.]|jgi:hypothetical protein|nr:methyltransferase [Lutibacter sp.]
MYHKLPTRRYTHTLRFLQSVLPAPATLLDLGVRNPFSEILEQAGYTVYNTEGEDLDLFPALVEKYQVDAVTAFEIFEHLLNPYSVLQQIKAPRLIATVPLRLWFKKAYRSHTDPWDRHFHEFEDWQFDWLLDKTAWEITRREKWTSPVYKIGLRPLLRSFTPRYYAVYAEKKRR